MAQGYTNVQPGKVPHCSNLQYRPYRQLCASCIRTYSVTHMNHGRMNASERRRRRRPKVRQAGRKICILLMLCVWFQSIDRNKEKAKFKASVID